MAEVNNTFEFKRCYTVLISTGRKARNLKELLDILRDVSADSIFHHTLQYFMKVHQLSYTNDFAQWAGESLEERALSERLSSIDPFEFSQIEPIRARLIETVESFLEEFPEPRDVFPGNEFYFNMTLSFVYPVGIRVTGLTEFLQALKSVDPQCIYYHFYEARWRLENSIDDFSMWLEHSLGEKALAEEVRAIDLFMHTIEGVRNRIVNLVQERLLRGGNE
ncbi:MAG: hypothetical protein D6710_09320 [Nitrospirae bacterium]|nr:MAG: hypothetical protein D6710_09320 [Nitrospirota bacterium]